VRRRLDYFRDCPDVFPSVDNLFAEQVFPEYGVLARTLRQTDFLSAQSFRRAPVGCFP
jgi:hypothetical protein